MQLNHLLLIILVVGHAQHMVVVAVRPLSLVKTLLLLVIVVICLVYLAILGTNKALSVFLVDCCHDLPADLGFWAFWDRVVFEWIFIVVHCGISRLNVTVINANHCVHHAVVVVLVCFNRHHYSILDLRMLVTRCWSWVRHPSSLGFREHIVQCLVQILLLFVNGRLWISWLSTYNHRQMVFFSFICTLQLMRSIS